MICVQTTQASINLLSPLLASKEITLSQGETTGIQWCEQHPFPIRVVRDGQGGDSFLQSPAGAGSPARDGELDVMMY